MKALFTMVMLAAAPAFAQTVTLGTTAPSAPRTCVQVQIPGQQPSPFDCLNQELQAQAESAAGESPIHVPLGAGSPSNTTGTFNQFGVAEQYGQNFGHSAIPYRPPVPVFSSPVH